MLTFHALKIPYLPKLKLRLQKVELLLQKDRELDLSREHIIISSFPSNHLKEFSRQILWPQKYCQNMVINQRGVQNPK
jgi:hypothetical protein